MNVGQRLSDTLAQMAREERELEREVRRLRSFPWFAYAPETRRLATGADLALKVLRAARLAMV